MVFSTLNYKVHKSLTYKPLKAIKTPKTPTRHVLFTDWEFFHSQSHTTTFHTSVWSW